MAIRRKQRQQQRFQEFSVDLPLSYGSSHTHRATRSGFYYRDPAGRRTGPTFNYGMNQRINFNLPPPANVPETPFKISQAVNPAAFIVFSEQRVHASETPYYGSNPADLSSTFNWCNRFSGRHSGTGNIVFGDAHVANLRYGYVVGLVGGKITDPKRPD